MSTAADFYAASVEERSRLRRLVSQVGFWFGTLISSVEGGPSGTPPSEDQVVVRDLNGNVVLRVDEVSELGESMLQMIDRDLSRLSASEFAAEWGIDRW